MPRTVRATAAGLVEIRRRLAEPRPLLDRLGTIGVRAAQMAFVDQRFGGTMWEPRYPGMTAPWINIAGTLADLNAGRSTPLARRLNPTPAGVDTGQTRQSIAHRVLDDTSVQIGSAVPHAGRINFGGESRQKVTPTARRALALLLRKKKWKPYREKLGFLFQTDELRTQVVARPFLGMYPELADDMVAATERWVAEGRA